ncbi:MAG: hypothetical protein AAF725_06005 [Acidobacteriota bacterium]
MTSSAAFLSSVSQALTWDIGAALADFLRPASPSSPQAAAAAAPRPSAAAQDEHEFRCRTEAWSDLSLYLPS